MKSRIKRPDKRLVRKYAANIATILASANAQEYNDGLTWYDRARNVASALAMRHDITLAQAANVIAALSPSVKWEQNCLDADYLISCFHNRQHWTRVNTSTYRNNNRLAYECLQGKRDTLNGQKTKAFSACIVNRHSASVCVDFHAIGVCHGRKYTVNHDAARITRGEYRAACQAYRLAARVARIKGYQCQAICWLVWRRTPYSYALPGVTPSTRQQFLFA